MPVTYAKGRHSCDRRADAYKKPLVLVPHILSDPLGFSLQRIFGAMLIDDLPVELILILLRGLSLADILNFTRTVNYFRCISLTNRRLWIDAFDSYRIRLPVGETLKTTNLALLPRNVARSVSIANRWRHRGPIHPIRTYEATPLYDLPSWAFWAPLKHSQRTLQGHAPPTFVNVLPGGRAFLFGSMGRLGVFDLRGQYGYELDVPFCAQFDPHPGDSATSVDWDSADNGVNTTIAVLSKALNEHHDVESKLTVFALHYARSGEAPFILRTHIFTLPINATVVSVKGHLILAHSRHTFLLVNLQTKERGCWLLYDTDECEITSANIDPAENTILLIIDSRRKSKRSVQIFDIPCAMESFERTPFWTCYPFAPRTVVVLPYPAFDADHARALLLSTTPARASTAAANMTPADITVLRPAYGHQMLAAVGMGELQVLRSIYASEHSIHASNELYSVHTSSTDIPERPDVLELSFPAHKMPGVGRALAFDDVYGIMVLFARGRLFVVQY